MRIIEKMASILCSFYIDNLSRFGVDLSRNHSYSLSGSIWLSNQQKLACRISETLVLKLGLHFVASRQGVKFSWKNELKLGDSRQQL